MSAVWITIIALTGITAAIKGAGPAVVGARELSPTVTRVISLFAPALLAALVVTETFGGAGRSITLDARAAGLAAATVVLATTRSLVGGVVAAAAVTALLRLVT
jgi:branched-subunit amino acid transport protein